MMDTQIDEHEAAAKRAREQMVAELCEGGWISSDRVAAAFLAVPRHQFADGAPLEEVYGAESIVRVKFDVSGQCVSSLSAPRAQSMMITMSGIQAGDAILEIGSGGVNAAYLAELTGPSGLVVSADIDPDVTDRASRCLDRAGYSRVVVTLADGAYGVPEHAPYQRILVTAGAHDVVPEWVAQLAEGGTLTVPLHIRGINRVISFIRDGAVLISTGHEMFGYVPMQGVARRTATVVRVGDRVRLVFDDDQPQDAHALAHAMDFALAEEVWTGVDFPEAKPFDLLHVWLVSSPLPGLAKVVVDPTAPSEARLSWPVMSPATTTGGSFAYLTCRKTNRVDADSRVQWEFGAIGYGPQGQLVAEQLAEQVQVWNSRYRHGPEPRFLVYPAGTADAQLIEGAVIEKNSCRIVVQWPQSFAEGTA